ncbi:MAG TPA: hypothetical protein VJ913_02055, partial [Actinomycetota bacterium]|nr:hypothetical protein [Actinomycetota bacterium]
GLASTLAAGVGDVRGCLILSRDGLVVGSYLPDGEVTVRPAWIRFAAVGEPERGFVQFGTETWCYVRRGPYAAFVVTGPGARPGLVLDHMDQLLPSAEEFRTGRSGAREDPAALPAAPSSKPRTPLHPDPTHAEGPVVIGSGSEAPVPPAVDPASLVQGSERPTDAVGSTDGDAPDRADGGTGEPSGSASPEEGAPAEPPGPSAGEPAGPGAGLWDLSDGEGDVDRFSLAREFGQLLQDAEEGADG